MQLWLKELIDGVEDKPESNNAQLNAACNTLGLKCLDDLKTCDLQRIYDIIRGSIVEGSRKHQGLMYHVNVLLKLVGRQDRIQSNTLVKLSIGNVLSSHSLS